MVDCNTYGVNDSPVPPASRCPSHPTSKNIAASSGLLRHNLPTKQSAPRSQKRAGAETPFRTAWIKHPILPRFCFNDPPAGGGSKQVILPEVTAVVRNGLSRSSQICLFCQAEPKCWMVEGGLRCCRGK